MFSSLKKLPGTALALILLTSPAYAAEVTAEGAAALKTLIQSNLDERRNLHSAAGDQLLTEGELKVEIADGYYAVTLPHIKVKDSSGMTIDLGMFAANVIPGDTPKEWKAAVAVPTPIFVTDADGKSLGSISLGRQHAVGVWDTDLGTFIRFDGEYNDIGFKTSDGKGAITAGKAAIKTVLTRDAATGNLSGPSSGIISDWSFSDPEENFSGKLKDISFEVTVKDFDPKVARSFNTQVGALGQNGQTLAGAADGSGQQGLAIYNMLTDVIGKSSDAFTTSFTFNGLSVTGQNKETKAPETMELGTFGFGFDMDGFRSGSVRLGLRMNYGGLILPGEATVYKDLIPMASKIDLNINKLPFAQLIELGRGAVSTAANDPNGAQMAGMTAMMTVPKLLTDAGTNLTHTLESTATMFNVEGKGVVTANMNAMMGYTAEQDLKFKGLDKVIAFITEEMKKPNNPETQSLQSVLGPLTMLQMVGQKDAADPDLRTYKLVVDDKGKTLLNGSDMSTLMGGSESGEPAPAPQPEAPAQ